MPQADPAAPGADDDPVGVLFDEYLDAVDGEQAPDVDALVARAGDRGPELRERIRMHEEVRRVSKRASSKPIPGLVPPEDIGGRLGRYHILRSIGKGGFGHVYLARDTRLHRDVALKVMTAGSGERALRALKEARSMARLEHPGIVRVFDVEEIDGYVCIAMEYISGPSLHNVLAALAARRNGSSHPTAADPLPAPPHLEEIADGLATYGARARLMRSIAEAVAFAHDHGVVHRDLKPSAIQLHEDGRPRVIDFGLGHLSAALEEEHETTQGGITQSLVGTPEYVAPEQIAANRTGSDPRSDQYALGVILYELLCLRNPFRRPGITRTLDAVERGDYRAPSRHAEGVPRDLELICLHCLEHRPEDRYPSTSALASDLAAYLDNRPGTLTGSSIQSYVRLWTRRNRRWLWIGGVVVAAVLAGLFAQAYMSVASDHAEVVARSREALSDDSLDPIDLFGAGVALTLCADEVERLDGGLTSRLFGLRSSEAVHEGALEWSRRIGEVIAQLEEQERNNRNKGDPMTWVRLEPALILERRLLAETNERRGLGILALPEGVSAEDVVLRTQRVLPVKQGIRRPPWFEVAFDARPRPGIYMVELRATPGSPRPVIELRRHSEWEPRRALDFKPPSPQVLSLMATIPKGVIVCDPPTMEPWEVGAHPVESFLLMEGPVTRGLLRALGLQAGEGPDADVATMTSPRIGELAAELGVRLPTAAELVFALRSGRIARVPGMDGEHVADATSDMLTLGGCYRYECPFPGWVDMCLVDKPLHALDTKFAFRFALSLEPRE